MDSRRKNAKMLDIKPQHTLTFEKELKVTSGSKVTRTAVAGISLGVAPHPQASLSATGTHAAERSQGTEQKQYSSVIYQSDIFGAVWWKFNVDDPTERREGIRIAKENLPSTKFQCRSDTSTDPLDIEVASYWSIIPADPPSNMDWIPKLLSKNTDKSRIFYSNLAQFVVMTVPHDIQTDSGYTATMKVNDGPQSLYVSDIEVTEQYGAVTVASAVSGKSCDSDFGNGESLDEIFCAGIYFNLYIWTGKKRMESMLRLPSLHNLTYSTDISLGPHNAYASSSDNISDTGDKQERKTALGVWMLDTLRSYIGARD